ncbi:hypothetical protein BLOT_003752 [Blomia tropicalis]|nr:hypothetical protein BLOT_003752 [Blomia tropicalis]
MKPIPQWNCEYTQFLGETPVPLNAILFFFCIRFFYMMVEALDVDMKNKTNKNNRNNNNNNRSRVRKRGKDVQQG